jgi:hypothetical protein
VYLEILAKMLAAASYHHPVMPLKDSEDLWMTEDLPNNSNLYPPPLNLSSSAQNSYQNPISKPISPANVPGSNGIASEGGIGGGSPYKIAGSDSYNVQGNGNSGFDLRRTLQRELDREGMRWAANNHGDYPSPRSTVHIRDSSPGVRSHEQHQVKSPIQHRFSPQEPSHQDRPASSSNLSSVMEPDETVPLTWPAGRLPDPPSNNNILSSISSKSSSHTIKLSRSENNLAGSVRTSSAQKRGSNRRSRLAGYSQSGSISSPSKDISGSFPNLEKKIVALEGKVDQLVPALERLTKAVDSLTRKLDNSSPSSRPNSRGNFSSMGTSTGSTYVSHPPQHHSRNASFASRSNYSRRPSEYSRRPSENPGVGSRSDSDNCFANPFDGAVVPELEDDDEEEYAGTRRVEVEEMARKFQTRGRQMSRWDTETEDEDEDHDDSDCSDVENMKRKIIEPLPPLPTATVKQVRHMRPSIVERRIGAPQPGPLNVAPAATSHKADIDVYPAPSSDWEWGWPLGQGPHFDSRKASMQSTASSATTAPLPIHKLPPLMAPTHELPPTPVTPVFAPIPINPSSTSPLNNHRSTPPPPRPSWYFFYGPLRDPALLHELLGLGAPPPLTPARVWGYTAKYFGVYPAAVDSDMTECITGTAWYVPRVEMAEWLRKYEEEMYVDRGVEIEFEGGEKGFVRGRMFVWKGGAGQLCDGPLI